ncbi:MAG TPA: hypothetical protein VLM76_15170 [Patescibacteria group bacterium]|nr:hypothetical protein [Patescibacteria group bacterium]
MTNPTTALAEALRTAQGCSNPTGGDHPTCVIHDQEISAIFAALPPDWCGHGKYESEMERLWALDRADLARLRAIEAAAREAAHSIVAIPMERDDDDDSPAEVWCVHPDPLAALRAALEADHD